MIHTFRNSTKKRRGKLAGATYERLTDMLIDSCKLRRVIQKVHAVDVSKLREIEEIVVRPSTLLNTPVIPTVDDLHCMMGDEEQT